jgi:hypothetical protein
VIDCRVLPLCESGVRDAARGSIRLLAVALRVDGDEWNESE